MYYLISLPSQLHLMRSSSHDWISICFFWNLTWLSFNFCHSKFLIIYLHLLHPLCVYYAKVHSQFVKNPTANCLSFLWLLWQITKNQIAENNRHLFCYYLVVEARHPKSVLLLWNQGSDRAESLLCTLPSAQTLHSSPERILSLPLPVSRGC